jgi:hypothetical protein
MSYDNGITFDSLGHTPGQVDYVNVIDREGNPLAYELPRWKANWQFKRRYSPAIATMMDGWDGGDPFGSAMEMAWAVAEVGRAMDEPEPGQTLNYRPSPLSYSRTVEEIASGEREDDISFTMECLAQAVQDGRVSVDDLVFAAKVLHRYIDICRQAGKDY